MTNFQISDATERELALDPTQSFVVQAPAGSGKTSLLVQRYLKLLSLVNSPEEIVSITFTRKAAFEMRTRIIDALKKADENILTKDSFAATTQKLAKAALKQDQIKKWNIIQNPNRLRLQTIDGFCHYLVNRTPILTKIDVNSEIVQNQEADLYYSKAAKAALENIIDPQYSTHLEQLLLHLDNDWQRVESLFITMLKSREQWLPHIVGLKNTTELRQKMELSLQEVSQENIEICSALFPQELSSELIQLLNFVQNNGETIQPFLRNIEFNDNKINSNLLSWQGVANLLLTKEFSWRKKITKEHGFPAPTTPGLSKAEKELFKSMKSRMEELLVKFNLHENLRVSLENLLLSPNPNYDDQQWKIIEALLELLPLLAAELKLIFHDNAITDHAEISISAYHALGNQESPSDLALNLDYSLQHLLIDEFQDTSISQYRLIEKLIASWQQDDGRTIFVVGDPMQSIYRFREAEVGLFLRTQHEGIGDLKLQPLTLTTNFRSTQTIIHWINTNFSKILPQDPDISFGAVPFEPSVAVANTPDSLVKIDLLKNADDDTEAAHVTSIIQKILSQTPNTTIAILVKSRNHLPKIISSLRIANLDYQAVELETFHTCMLIRDLVSLTCALFDLTDRVAWIAILRAPWCGLNLKDLHKIAHGKNKLIWDNICNHQELNLSDTGKTRLIRFLSAITPFFNQRERMMWHELIEKSWLAIGGPATAENKEELEYAEIYLELFKNSQFDLTTIRKKLASLYTPTTPNAKIQIMTIHKAKGLEFDHVFIPGLNRATRSDDHKLMLWFERPKLHQGSRLILAPIKASGNDSDHVYQYLRVVEQKKSFYETGRLLYVAMTRAKKSIHLTGCIKIDEENRIANNIQTGSLLEQLKPCFDANWVQAEAGNLNTASITMLSTEPQPISYLSENWQLPVTISISSDKNTSNWQLNDEQAANIGTVVHHCMRQISESKLENWTDDYLLKQKPYWRKLLLQTGHVNIIHGLEIITKAVQTALKDERGRWILTNHLDAMSELAITTTVDHKFKNYIIDRTFVDEDNVRWIIDYKTSQPDKISLEEFLNQEKIKYYEQLLQYAAAMQPLDPNRNIKLALYFPLCRGWIEVKFPPIK